MSDRQDRQALPEDAALRTIVEGVESATGERFFASLVEHLAVALGVQYAFVSELSQDHQRFRTLALWGRGRLLDNLEFPVVGTPCEAVLNGEMSHHPDRLQELFPADRGLVDWGVHSYCGVPLLDAGGTVVGHLAILDDKPMPDGTRGLAVMRIFAARARAEIERLETDAALRAGEERLRHVIASASDGIVSYGDDLRIQLFNAAAERILRCSAAEAIGTSVERFAMPEGLERVRRAIERFKTEPDALIFVGEADALRARRADGSVFIQEASLSRCEVGGRPLYTVIFRDLEERKNAAREMDELQRQNTYLREEIRSVHNFEEIVGASPTLRRVLEQVDLVAATDSSVLIYGETGTGKELIARAIHARSGRKARPLVKVNCAALPAGLVESELFGHEKGAFTGATERRIGRFELAHGGTIFLDEVGELSPEIQVKLLRVLQERELERVGGSQTVKVDVRVIAATNRDLPGAVGAGTFRQDLYYRLNVFPVTLPPLRERPEDVPLLVHYFVARYAAKIGRRISRVPKETMGRLAAYAWPGNVRELENVVERAVILSAGPDLVVARRRCPQSLPRSCPSARPQPTLSRSSGSSARTSSRSSGARTGGWTVRVAQHGSSTCTRARCAAGCRSSASGEARSRLRRSAKCRGRPAPRGPARDITASARRDGACHPPALPCRRRHERCSPCFPTMMRITRVPGTDGVARLHIEGRLMGDGVKELAASCEAYLAVRHPLLLDVADVTFADRAGLGLLETVVRRGAALTGCSPFLDELLRDHRGGS